MSSSSSIASPSPELARPETQLAALLHGAGMHPLESKGWIRVTGDDRVRWLNGMVTNSVQQLQPGQGCYSFLLNVQGRIQGDATVYATPEALLIETGRGFVARTMEMLDRYIIMDDVELADISSERQGLLVAGPRAETLLELVGLSAAELPVLSFRQILFEEEQMLLIHAASPLVPRYEIWGSAKALASVASLLETRGALSCAAEAIESLRLLSGTPEYGRDIGERDLPQETRQDHALHFAKGCYLGQEIVERIRSRGNVHRALTLFRLEGSLPGHGTPITAQGKVAGEFTSSAAVPLGPSSGTTLQLALGYVRREALDSKADLIYPGGIALPISAGYMKLDPASPESNPQT